MSQMKCYLQRSGPPAESPEVTTFYLPPPELVQGTTNILM